MPHDVRVYLEDLQRYLGSLQGMIEGKNAEDFEADLQLRWAVERVFEIVGELLRRMVTATSETEERIDSVGRIIGFRNVLAHEYDKIEDDRVWNITQQNLPRLINQVNSWAAELDMKVPPEPAS